ncbi:GNAT family N-acetyltransferase [Bradyrhizobium sp. S69]|jgi:GNAT superfamily N-acetyltransferase|uniref:GNAT family N-acetyltransferase n=1 Tax=Bradyrhizobium sp. S69 TaxID=1641856 RepID=UPI00131CFE96|nr:GNAT family N-acetyltransferase [Bradyrhizobium sp. S69]
MSTLDAASPAPFGWQRAAASGVRFRSIAEADLPFLYRVYASTRAEELAPVPWSEAQKAAFLTMQFQAQHTEYQRSYPDAAWLVILRAGEPAGRLYLGRGNIEHCVIDIALLPEHRGHGLGAAIMRDLMDEAGRAGKRLAIHVEKFNPAMHLYRRLGFQTVEDKGVYDLMHWSAAPSRSIP